MDGIIFDVDGTLWDSTEVVAKAWNEVLRTRTTLPPTVDRPLLKTLFGKPMNEICQVILKGIPEEDYDPLGEICFQYENELLLKEPVPLYPCVLEAFQALSQKCPLFIVSNCQIGYIEILLQTTPLAPYVTGHLCYGETLTSKGKTIRTLMNRYGLSKVFYVGDTQGDADACREADVPFVFVEYGFGEVSAPDYRVSSLMELSKLPVWD